MDTSKVTRFEVTDHSGANCGHGQWLGVAVELSLQDDGRTLKVFLADSPDATPHQVREAMAAGLKEFITQRT